MISPILYKGPQVPVHTSSITPLIQIVHETAIEKLGEGGAATVVRGTDPTTGSPIAKKKFYDSHLAEAEFEVFKALQGNKIPHMVRCRRMYIDNFEQKWLDLDLICAKNIYEAHLGKGSQRLELDEIKSLAYQLLEFCNGMEAAMYIHRDLSPDNLIWERVSRKLTVIDFGASHKIGFSEKWKSRTSFLYAPPEFVLKKISTSSYDLWSVGCVIFELITGEPFCEFGIGLGTTESYQYTLQQIVSQIGLPGPEFIRQCDEANKCFDVSMNLINKWETRERPLWRDMVEQSLNAKKTAPEEIEQWIDFLRRLLSYENRGSAKEYLEIPLFKIPDSKEVQVNPKETSTKICMSDNAPIPSTRV